MSILSAAETNLKWLLRPIEALVANPALTDLHINGVGEGMAYVDVGQGMTQMTLPYSFSDLEAIAINAATLNGNQDVGPDVPIVDGRFPGGHRVHIARPPATPDGTIALSIRQPKEKTPTPMDLERGGSFEHTGTGVKQIDATRHELDALHRSRRYREFLELAIASSLNIVFCGKVGTGKTHVLRSFTHAIPPEWRIITIEDTQELINLPCRNVVHLLYSKSGQSSSSHGARELVQAAMRMGMDGILAQELRDSSAASFLSILQSGHWGMSTTHSESPEDAFPRIAGLIKEGEAGRHQDERELIAKLKKSIHIVVYCIRRPDGKRVIDDILYQPASELAAA